MRTKIDTVTSRTKLQPRRDPYWNRISKGCYLGYRKMSADSSGSWCARCQDEATGKQRYQAIGALTHVADHLRFDAAQKEAIAWFEHLGRGGRAELVSVRTVCAYYAAHIRETKTEAVAIEIERRFNSYVLNNNKLAETDITKLKPHAIEEWRRALKFMPTRAGKLRADSTLNRDMTCFRAALNFAYSEGLVTTDFAWRGKLLPIKNAERRRELYLDRDQRRKFIEKAEPSIAIFLRGMAILPLRPGALAALKVGDYDHRLKVLKIGKDKSGMDRKIKLPESTAHLFDEAVKDKLPNAPLLSRNDGRLWDKDAWKKPVKEAAKAAGLPLTTTCYTMRHSIITDLVHDGLDLLTVAQISGTSVRMIEQHYGHLRADVATSALGRLAL